MIYYCCYIYVSVRWFSTSAVATNASANINAKSVIVGGNGSGGGIEYEYDVVFEKTPSSSVTLVMCMILLNEESNLRLNLPFWRDIIDAYVFGIDDRTDDNTVKVITELLPSFIPREIVHFTFNDGGFSSARNIVINTAWIKFSWISHIIIADPD